MVSAIIHSIKGVFTETRSVMLNTSEIECPRVKAVTRINKLVHSLSEDASTNKTTKSM